MQKPLNKLELNMNNLDKEALKIIKISLEEYKKSNPFNKS